MMSGTSSVRFLMILTVLVGLCRPAEGGPYANHPLIEVRIETVEQLEWANQNGILLACHPGLGLQRMVVAPDRLDAMATVGLDFRVIKQDVQQLIDDAARVETRGGGFYSSFQEYPQIESHLAQAVAINPAIATKTVIGQSLEGRDIHAIRVTSPGTSDKPVVVVTGGQHAREWISPTSVIWSLEQLISNYGTDPELTMLVDSVDWCFIPVVNPDGYQYTHDGFRLWRKNRRPNGNGSFGVDLNRNWGFKWNQGLPGSSSGNPNSETYRGTGPFSEPESQVVSNYILSLENVRGHVDVHSYGQLILGAWSYNDQILPPRADELRLVQDRMELVMSSAFGVAYEAGLGVDQLLYTADGTVPDWTFGVLGAMSWTYELRPDSPNPGFEISPVSIVPTAAETFAGLRQLGRFVTQTIFIEPEVEVDLLAADRARELDVIMIGMNGASLEPGTAKLRFRDVGAAEFDAVDLSGSGPLLRAVFPAFGCDAQIEYYYEAQTSEGALVTLPSDAPATVFSSDVSQFIADEAIDFEVDAGWAPQAEDTLDGLWQRGVPVDDPNWAYDPASDSDGSGYCFMTNNALGATGVRDGIVRLISPPLDFDVSADVQITYDYFLRLTDESGNDGLTVDIGPSSGAGPWKQIAVHDRDAGPEWQRHVITQSELDAAGVVLQPIMRLRWSATEEWPTTVVEAAIDRVLIEHDEGCPAENCPGDANGDQSIDIADLNLVIGNFASGGPIGDLNEDGAVNIADLNLVIGNFGSGCP